MATVVADIDAGQGINVVGGIGGYKATLKQFTPDTSYPTGGMVLTPGDFGLASFSFVHAQSAGGFVFSMDYTNSKLLAYKDAGAATAMAEVANAVNLATAVTRVFALGPPA